MLVGDIVVEGRYIVVFLLMVMGYVFYMVVFNVVIVGMVIML